MRSEECQSLEARSPSKPGAPRRPPYLAVISRTRTDMTPLIQNPNSLHHHIRVTSPWPTSKRPLTVGTVTPVAAGEPKQEPTACLDHGVLIPIARTNRSRITPASDTSFRRLGEHSRDRCCSDQARPGWSGHCQTSRSASWPAKPEPVVSGLATYRNGLGTSPLGRYARGCRRTLTGRRGPPCVRWLSKVSSRRLTWKGHGLVVTCRGCRR